MLKRNFKVMIYALVAICAIMCLCISVCADSGITIQITGVTRLDGYTVTGTYYDIGSTDKVQTVVATDRNGYAYFALPSDTYSEFDYSVTVNGFEITGVKAVSEIKAETPSIIKVDASWATALGTLVDDDIANGAYNAIDSNGTAYSNMPSDTTMSDNTETDTTTDTIAGVETVDITINIKSDTILDLLRESCNVTLTGVNGSANINVKLNAPTTRQKIKLTNGSYSISVSSTENTVVAPTECTVKNGKCEVTLEVLPACTLVVSDANKTDTQYLFKGINATYITDGTPIAVENKRNYILKCSNATTGYSLTIPTYAHTVWFDFATGELLTDKTDNTQEELQGSVDNPYGIAETIDKGYSTTPTVWDCILATFCSIGIVIICVLCYKHAVTRMHRNSN